ncbi:MAG: hypothetical protein PHS26_08640, partial [Actinomycetota bacterium]|nr:hypothetical protein [Actinomycetota bacterium]
MISWKRTFGIHICCSFLVLAFLVAVPIVTATVGGQAEAEGLAGSCAQKDPLDRLPSSPEEAQERLAEREIGWPDDAAGTGFEAAAVRPDVRVALPYDSVEGFITHASANVKIEVVGKGEKTVAADASGWFKADMSTVCDIVSGDVVKVTDMADASTATINCTLTANIDFGNNRVSGVTNGNANVDVYIVAPSTYYADLPPGAAHKRTVALAGGGFAATFAELDLRRGDIAFVFSKDANGNKVMDVASGSGAGLVVYPQYDDVMGDYIPGTALAVKADAETINVTAMKDGFFEAWFQDYDIIDGTNVACNMGGSRSIVVRDVSANCDPATNRVDGTGPANRPMRVTMDPYGAPVVYNATSDAAGAFAVDLGAAYTASGTDVYNVTWYDDDGDCVVYEFQTFSWYLAEGCTAGGFDTWVLVQNPNDEPANVVL